MSEVDNSQAIGSDGSGRRIVVDIAKQRLYLLKDKHGEGQLLRKFRVSTAARGSGQIQGSECTPLGRHIVRARIGAGLPEGAVLEGRRPTGETFSASLAAEWPERDWILSRILWLSGTEIGHNRLGNVDTMRRFIYIHGSPQDSALGKPDSHGCVRMRNRDVIELFEEVPAGTPVEIRRKGGWR